MIFFDDIITTILHCYAIAREDAIAADDSPS
jgi:hypothetical protein